MAVFAAVEPDSAKNCDLESNCVMRTKSFSLQNDVRITFLILLCIMFRTQAEEDYRPHPDSQPQEGVPKGTVEKFSFSDSKIFPGTVHDYWVYVPAQYEADKPACVHVNQDGIQNNAPVVFDNLIAKKYMPVTIGVFVSPGVVKAANSNVLERFNRRYEYSRFSGDYVLFLIDTIVLEDE